MIKEGRERETHTKGEREKKKVKKEKERERKKKRKRTKDTKKDTLEYGYLLWKDVNYVHLDES